VGGGAVIRRARAEDAEAVAGLSDQLGYPTSPEEVERRLRRILGDDGHALFVAEDRDGKVIGWVHIYLCPLVEVALQAEVGGLVVDERHRGQGVGQRLLEWAEQWAAQKGCSAVTVRSNVIRERAHRFYARLGYRTVKTQRVFTKSLKEEPHGA